LESLDREAPMDCRGLRVRLGFLELLGLRVLKEFRDQVGLKVHKVRLELLGRRDLRDRWAHWDRSA
jgi:hypothetical protein